MCATVSMLRDEPETDEVRDESDAASTDHKQAGWLTPKDRTAHDFCKNANA